MICNILPDKLIIIFLNINLLYIIKNKEYSIQTHLSRLIQKLYKILNTNYLNLILFAILVYYKKL